MTFRSLAACGVLIFAASCGAASDVTSGDGPTTIPMFDTVEESTTSTTSTVGEEPTTSRAPTTSSSTTSSVAPTTGPSTVTSSTAPPTTIDPFAPYCASYGRLLSIDTALDPTDPEGIEAVFTELDAAWGDAEALAPSEIGAEVVALSTFISELRAMLAANDYDFGAVIGAATELEQELGVDVAQILVDQFAYLECGVEPELPADQTAVFYASLLDTAERRGVLVDLLVEDGTFSIAGATCFADRATADAVFPLVGAPSTADQQAALSQILGICQLAKDGS